jgi:voltage-gated sodium channel
MDESATALTCQQPSSGPLPDLSTFNEYETLTDGLIPDELMSETNSEPGPESVSSSKQDRRRGSLGLGYNLKGSISERSSRRTKEGCLRYWLGCLLKSLHFNLLVASVISFNIAIVIMDADAKADEREPESWWLIADRIILIFYCAEMTIRLYVYKLQFFCHRWNLFDITVVSVDVASAIAWNSAPPLTCLRMLRGFRIFRVVGILKQFRELFIILHSLSSATKAIFWSTVLIVIVLIMWSLVAVEMINGLVIDVAEDGGFRDCERCKDSFSSVWSAMLSLVEFIISGDNFGYLALPLIEKYPFSVLFFIGVFATITLGLMNIIMAVIVDRAADARREDEVIQLQEKKAKFMKIKRVLQCICEEMDHDQSGTLSLSELLLGVDHCESFAKYLATMDVTRSDLKLVFDYLDVGNTGRVSYKEFVQRIHQLRTSDSHSLQVLVKHQVSYLCKLVDEQQHAIASLASAMASQISGHAEPEKYFASLPGLSGSSIQALASSITSENKASTRLEASIAWLDNAVRQAQKSKRENTEIEAGAEAEAKLAKHRETKFEDVEPKAVNHCLDPSSLESCVDKICSAAFATLHDNMLRDVEQLQSTLTKDLHAVVKPLGISGTTVQVSASKPVDAPKGKSNTSNLKSCGVESPTARTLSLDYNFSGPVLSQTQCPRPDTPVALPPLPEFASLKVVDKTGVLKASNPATPILSSSVPALV